MQAVIFVYYKRKIVNKKTLGVNKRASTTSTDSTSLKMNQMRMTAIEKLTIASKNIKLKNLLNIKGSLV